MSSETQEPRVPAVFHDSDTSCISVASRPDPSASSVSLVSRGTDTGPLTFLEASTQTDQIDSKQTQTSASVCARFLELYHKTDPHFSQRLLASLQDTLLPRMIQELDADQTSTSRGLYPTHTTDSLQRQDATRDSARMLFAFASPDLPEGELDQNSEPLLVGSGRAVAWNCKGTLVAVGYGRHDHLSWCEHRSRVSIWNILKPVNRMSTGGDYVIDLPVCVSSIAFHPSHPTILAVGLYTGEVRLYNIAFISTQGPDSTGQSGLDPLLARSSLQEYTHSEPVTSLQFQKNRLFSVGLDGRVLCWDVMQAVELSRLSVSQAIIARSDPSTAIGGERKQDEQKQPQAQQKPESFSLSAGQQRAISQSLNHPVAGFLITLSPNYRGKQAVSFSALQDALASIERSQGLATGDAFSGHSGGGFEDVLGGSGMGGENDGVLLTRGNRGPPVGGTQIAFPPSGRGQFVVATQGGGLVSGEQFASPKTRSLPKKAVIQYHQGKYTRDAYRLLEAALGEHKVTLRKAMESYASTQQLRVVRVSDLFAGLSEYVATSRDYRRQKGGGRTEGDSVAHLLYRPVDASVYDGHVGRINGLAFSPFHEYVFASCGDDGAIRLYHSLRRSPVLVITPPRLSDLEKLTVNVDRNTSWAQADADEDEKQALGQSATLSLDLIQDGVGVGADEMSADGESKNTSDPLPRNSPSQFDGPVSPMHRTPARSSQNSDVDAGLGSRGGDGGRGDGSSVVVTAGVSGSFTSVSWSPSRPTVLAAALTFETHGSAGRLESYVLVYDLSHSRLNPTLVLGMPLQATVSGGASRHSVSSPAEPTGGAVLAFNSADARLLSCLSRDSGVLSVWELGRGWASAAPGEAAALQKLAEDTMA